MVLDVRSFKVESCGACPFISCNSDRYCMLAEIRRQPLLRVIEGDVPRQCPLVKGSMWISLAPGLRKRLRLQEGSR